MLINNGYLVKKGKEKKNASNERRKKNGGIGTKSANYTLLVRVITINDRF